MSRTDKDRPYYIRVQDRLDATYNGVEHSAFAHGRGECDAHTPVNASDLFRTECGFYGRHFGPYCSPARARDGRKAWHRRHRASARQFLGELIRSANHGDVEAAEDLIDNRQTHRFAEYGGGYWD